MLRKIFAKFLSITIIAVVLSTNVAMAKEYNTDGLIGFWSLDQDTIEDATARDVFGDNHAEIIDHSGIVEARINESLELDGVDDYIQLPDMGAEAAVTIEAWVMVVGDAPIPGNIGIVSHSGWAAGIIHFKINVEDPAIMVDKADGGNIRSQPIERDTWYHCVYTCDTAENKLKLYIDGEMVSEGTAGANPADLTSLRIGSEFDGRYFFGIIDEVRVYNRALSDDEVKQNYEVESSSVVFDPSSKLAFCWGQAKL